MLVPIRGNPLNLKIVSYSQVFLWWPIQKWVLGIDFNLVGLVALFGCYGFQRVLFPLIDPRTFLGYFYNSLISH